MTTTPVPPKRAARKRRPHRIGEIQRAALKLFHEQGYAETSMEDIGAAVGMAGPSIYLHFPSKIAILESVLRPIGDAYFAEMEEILALGLDPQAQLERLAELHLLWLGKDPVVTSVTVRTYKYVSAEHRAEVERNDRRLIRHWADAVTAARPDLDREEVRVLVHGALEMVLSLFLAQPPLPRKRAYDLGRRTLLAVLAA